MPFERQLLSHHFVATVLRDMYGVHVTCVSALSGPFGLPLLEPLLATLNAANANALQKHIYASRALPEPAVPPGWCQVHFSHLMQPYEVDYVIRAVAEVGAHGWKLLPQYRLDPRTGAPPAPPCTHAPSAVCIIMMIYTAVIMRAYRMCTKSDSISLS